MKEFFKKRSPLGEIILTFMFINILIYGFLIFMNCPLLESHMRVSLFVSLSGIIISGVAIYILFSKLELQHKSHKEATEDSNKALKSLNEALNQQLYIDPLTKLGNRKALEEEIEKTEKPKLVILDVDDFCNINDYFGKKAANEVLLHFRDTLQKLASGWNMSLFRIGADEFALLENAQIDIERYEEIAQTISKTFKGKRIAIKELGQEIEISATIGVALEHKDILGKALLALNEAKNLQRDYLCYFRNIDKISHYAKQLAWSNRIQDALENDGVIPYFQPIFDRNAKIVKYESLARLINSNEEVFSPISFIGTSQKVRLYAQVEKRIIEKSLRSIVGTSHVISLNLLARDMTDSDVSSFIVDRLLYYGVAKQVVIEILEDESIEHVDRIETFIARIKRMGVKVAIDDFGTGYSNFAYILKLKPDYLKIDGSIVRHAASDPNAYAIIGAITVFARKLGIKTIAEFVHSKEVYDACYELGVDRFQGFYLGEPHAKIDEDER